MTDDRREPERLTGDLLILARQAGAIDPLPPEEPVPPGPPLRARLRAYVEKKWWLAKRRISRVVHASTFPLLLAGLVLAAWFLGEGLMYYWVEGNSVARIEWMAAELAARDAASAARRHGLDSYLGNYDNMQGLLPDLFRECIPADPNHRVLELWVRDPEWGGVHFIDPPIAGTPLGDCVWRKLNHPNLGGAFPYILVLADPGTRAR